MAFKLFIRCFREKASFLALRYPGLVFDLVHCLYLRMTLRKPAFRELGLSEIVKGG
jgi:hypothetical protein